MSSILPYILAGIRLKEITPILSRAGFQTEIRLRPLVGRLVIFAQLSLALALTATALRVCINYFHLASAPAGIDPSNVFAAHADAILASTHARIPQQPVGSIADPKDPAVKAKEQAAATEKEKRAQLSLNTRNLVTKTFLLAQDVTGHPGVLSVAVMNPVPFSLGAGSGQFVSSGDDTPGVFSAVYNVHGDLPKTLGMSMVSGRWFDDKDEQQYGSSVIVVSELLSKRLYKWASGWKEIVGCG